MHECGHMLLGRLGELLEHRQRQTRTVRLLVSDLESSLYPGGLSALSAVWNLTDFHQRVLQDSAVSVAFLHEEFEQVLEPLYSSSDALWYDVENPAQARRLYKRLRRCRRELRRNSALIAILQKAAGSAGRFFCCVRWERRRWFLHHGARPPKATAQAILSLFAGACSGPLIA